MPTADPASSSSPALRAVGWNPDGGGDAPAGYPAPANSAPEPVQLEFGMHSSLPAVLIAAPPEAIPATEAVSAAESGIIEEFLSKTNQPSPPDETMEEKDRRWDAAAHLADERYRSLFGKDAYLKKSLQAGRLTRQIPSTAP